LRLRWSLVAAVVGLRPGWLQSQQADALARGGDLLEEKAFKKP